MRRLVLLSALLSLFAACRTAPSVQDAPVDAPPPPFVPGEALLKADRPLTADALKAGSGLEDLLVESIEPQFGQIALVRFRHVTGSGQVTVDEAYTRRAIEAFRRVEGVVSVEPNAIEQPRKSP